MNDFTPEEMRILIRQGITDWLDQQFSRFARWTVKSVTFGILSAVFAALMYAAFRGESFADRIIKALFGGTQ